MRSIFRVIFLRFIGIVVLSFLGTFATRTLITHSAAGASARNSPALEAQLHWAVALYRSGGNEQLQSYLKRLGESQHADIYLVDSAGKDVAIGTDRSRLLQQEKSGLNIPYLGHTSEIRSIALADKSYALAIVTHDRFNFTEFFSYYAWTFISILLLSWWVAQELGSPLHELRLAVEQFGRGDLRSRVGVKRNDEIGRVARAFNHMAAQIQGLLTNERRLLQDISHELRSPLARLSCAIELARTSTDREGTIERIHKESRRLNDLVNQLLEVTFAEGDPAAMRTEPIELNQLVEALLDDCRIEADARRCSFDLHANGRFEVQGDRELLHRAIENIVRNAIRYSQPGGTIEVGLVGNRGSVRLTIRDHGIGVPEQFLADIFKPFFRVESHRGPEGVGLGLALAQRAITLHQGLVRAQNANPGLAITIELQVLALGSISSAPAIPQ
jgi:signal transduction histidine kinase